MPSHAAILKISKCENQNSDQKGRIVDFRMAKSALLAMVETKHDAHTCSAEYRLELKDRTIKDNVQRAHTIKISREKR